MMVMQMMMMRMMMMVLIMASSSLRCIKLLVGRGGGGAQGEECISLSSIEQGVWWLVCEGATTLCGLWWC